MPPKAKWIGGAYATYSKILRQEPGHNVCGPCCVGMVAQLLRKNPGELDQFFDETNDLGVKGGWNPDGASPKYMEALLKSISITSRVINSTGLPQIKEVLRQTTLLTPRIVMVKLPTSITKNTSGYHWVVYVRRQTRGFGKASDYTVYDPLYPGEWTVRGSDRYTSPLGRKATPTTRATPGTNLLGTFECVICCQ